MPRSTTIRRICALALIGIAVGSCTVTESSASDLDAPLPTIGLGADFGDAATIPGDRVADDADVESVVMIGDSITVASMPALEQTFDTLGFDDVEIAAETGKRMARSVGDNPSGAEIVRYIVGADGGDSSGQLWVVALGTNDVSQYAGPDEIAAAVNEVLNVVPDNAPLVWVDTYYRDEAAGADLLNTVVADRLSRRGNAVMAPWNAFASGDGVLRSDGVHPSSDGTQVFADVVRATVERFLDR